MATALAVITGAMTFHLNRLSPGETLDADTAQRCLDALNDIVDEQNGQKSFLFRDVLSAGVVTGASGTLGTTWAGLVPGDLIEGATVAYSAGNDTPLPPLSFEQYANIPNKATAGMPQTYTYDGFATVYFYPACTGQTVTLHTRAAASSFADTTTDYGMPQGRQSALSVLLAERIAPAMLGAIPPAVAVAAARARSRLLAQNITPSIIQTARPTGDILTGFR